MEDARTGGGAARIALYALLVVLGALVAVAGALVQTAWFPGGLVLALAGAVGLFYGGTQLVGGRGGVGAPAAGWLVAVVLLTAPRPEGDFVFGAGAGSYVFLIGGMLAAVICATIGGFARPGAPVARRGE
ncbi:hypothetical protein DWB77_02790 [Streptomyces hundungensis]|uniref:Integral membrane protein n=1 Tax=Streptomyces hundungensis TaxID=1077946 RepID=A0A387HIM5_9ACTN|nr:DUF6113 family protein [Streptomyces hundungensis]AYG80652.1 hypothetical protein DWB77_02790 [Streptomyces hundungensis]